MTQDLFCREKAQVKELNIINEAVDEWWDQHEQIRITGCRMRRDKQLKK